VESGSSSSVNSSSLESPVPAPPAAVTNSTLGSKVSLQDRLSQPIKILSLLDPEFASLDLHCGASDSDPSIGDLGGGSAFMGGSDGGNASGSLFGSEAPMILTSEMYLKLGARPKYSVLQQQQKPPIVKEFTQSQTSNIKPSLGSYGSQQEAATTSTSHCGSGYGRQVGSGFYSSNSSSNACGIPSNRNIFSSAPDISSCSYSSASHSASEQEQQLANITAPSPKADYTNVKGFFYLCV